MASASKPSFEFWFDEKFYTVQGAETLFRMATKDDLSTIRSEYTRMRDVAQKRLHRLEKAFPESKALQAHPKGFPRLKDIDKRDLPKAFAELAKFVKAKASTVTGQREIKAKTIKTWRDQGLDLNDQNYNQVIKILEEMRRQKVFYGSDKAVSLAETMLNFDDSAMSGNFVFHLEELIRNEKAVQNWVEERREQGEPVDMDDLIREFGW